MICICYDKPEVGVEVATTGDDTTGVGIRVVITILVDITVVVDVTWEIAGMYWVVVSGNWGALKTEWLVLVTNDDDGNSEFNVLASPLARNKSSLAFISLNSLSSISLWNNKQWIWTMVCYSFLIIQHTCSSL